MAHIGKKNVVVTGALGHIGSRLVRDLPEPLVGKLTMIDNLATQRYPSLFDLPNHFHYQFIENDIRTADLEKYFQNTDIVIHLAAITNAEESVAQEEKVIAVNLDGLKRTARACLKTKTKLIFPSTTSVYGSQLSIVDETCKELKPQSPYAVSKLAAEEYLRELLSEGLEFVICRLGTIFGWSIGMRFHTAVNKFIWQAVNDMPLTVWKTAWNQRRPYLDLDDCVRAISFIIERDLFNGETYNILTNNITVENIVTAIQKFVPTLKVQYVDSPIMNQLSYDVDDSKFVVLGFKPTGNLERGVSKTIKRLSAVNIV